MKKINRILLCLIILSFCICIVACDRSEDPQIVEIEVENPNAGYKIENIGDKYYLILEELKNKKYPGIHGGIQIPPEIKASSVEEMRDKILNGELTEKDEENLVRIRRDENGRISMFDPYMLYNSITPTEVEIKNVSWDGGANYSVSLTPRSSSRDYFSSGDLLVRINDSFIRELNKEIYNADTAKDNLVKKEETKKDGIEATVYFYYDEEKVNNEYRLKRKEFFYEIETQSGTLKVIETHSYNYRLNDKPEFRVYIYGEAENCGYRYILHFLQEPSVEWLSQFGVEPVKFD